MTKVETVAPKYSPELLAACEKTLKNHDLRCKPGITLEDVVNTLTANQVTVEESFGQLALTMNGQPAHTQKVMEGLATQRTELFFPRELGAITARDQMDQKGKIQMLSEPGGLSRFENLPATAEKVDVVVLDPSRITRKQWMSLDLKTRSDLAGQWGSAVLGKIMAKK